MNDKDKNQDMRKDNEETPGSTEDRNNKPNGQTSLSPSSQKEQKKYEFWEPKRNLLVEEMTRMVAFDGEAAGYDVGYVPFSEDGHPYKPYAYYYEQNELWDLWLDMAKWKEMPTELVKDVSTYEWDMIMTLFDLWKRLFGYSIGPGHLGWRDMHEILHVSHFDVLMELYFNYKYRNYEH